MPATSPYAEQLRRIPVRERAASVNGAITRWWEYGDEHAATTIVMVHGFRGDHHGLEPIVAQLPRYRVIAPDLPGFGSSSCLAGAAHDIDGYSAWLGAFILQARPSGRLVLLGHSFGSIIVAAALAGGLPAAASPAEVVLVNPIAAPALQGPRGFGTRLAVLYYRLGAALPERAGFGLLRNRAIVRGMSMAMAKTHDRRLRAWIHEQHDRYFSAFDDRRVVLEAFRASVSHDVSEYAARIPHRTLLIGASRDDITTVAAQTELVTAFPNARLHIIDGVGHLVHYEAPREAAAQIEAFLADGQP